MSAAEPTTRNQHRVALWVVILAVIAVGSVMVWEHLSPPPGLPLAPRVNESATGPIAGFDALYAALGLRRPAEPAAAPDFALPSLNGQALRLRELRGKLVLLNFWATWCAPCLHEMPSMERLYQTFKHTPFTLLAVSLDRQGEAAARPFVDSLKLTFPVLLDNSMEVSRQYHVRGLPSTYLIDPDGVLIGVAIGARDWYKTEAKALIAGLLRQLPAPGEPIPPAFMEGPADAAGTQGH